jgi:hypothetical protein
MSKRVRSQSAPPSSESFGSWSGMEPRRDTFMLRGFHRRLGNSDWTVTRLSRNSLETTTRS